MLFPAAAPVGTEVTDGIRTWRKVAVDTWNLLPPPTPPSGNFGAWQSITRVIIANVSQQATTVKLNRV